MIAHENGERVRIGKAVVGVLVVLCLCALHMSTVSAGPRRSASTVRGADVSSTAPILLVTSASNPFTQYYTEILHAEGLNEFTTVDIASVTSAILESHDVVILGSMPLTSAQVSVLSDWVNGGGNLIAMRPDAQLAGLLGLTPAGGTLNDGYLLVAQSGPGLGIVNATIQFHDAADLYTLNGASNVATLYAIDGVTPTSNPAVTIRDVGPVGGHAVAFTYDLSRSVVYTHQGNPAFVGQHRDGLTPSRSDDLFFPNYLNLDKVAIPQADEQQRLLANLITSMNLDKKPLPRFWYLPNGVKAAIVHALDDHDTLSGTKDTFDRLNAASPPGCSVADWQCLRGTSWAYAGVGLTPSEAVAYQAQGFELGVHVAHSAGDCTDFTSAADLDTSYTSDLNGFQALFPGIVPQTTHRFHCSIWSDWLTQAKVGLTHGIRYNMDYYYWPGTWLQNRPGLFTGSAIPMRFADTDGTAIDVYQGVSQWVNENFLPYPSSIDALVQKAVGPEGFYGIFGDHDDSVVVPNFLGGVISTALAYNVPVITARQALTWLDARNGSTLDTLTWDGTTLGFMITPATAARNLQAMLPVNSRTNSLGTLMFNGTTVSYTTQTIKGVQYAFFAAASGPYTATYNRALIPPPSGGMTLFASTAVPAQPSVADPNPVELGVKFTSDRRGLINGIRFYKGTNDTGKHLVNLWTSAGGQPQLLATATSLGETASGWQQVNFQTPVPIQAGTTYIASYHTDVGNYAADTDFFANNAVDSPPLHALPNDSSGGNGVYTYGASAFPAATYRSNNYWVDVAFVDIAARSLWNDGTRPAIESANDPGPVELGVKFQSDVAGKITGIRFYKGPANPGPHGVTLWSSSGAVLATATSTTESNTGWQQVLFSAPVDITANTTYVASYHATNGGYAADSNYFNNNYDNAPLHAPSTTTSDGGNGVFLYGSGGFPARTAGAANYWVDVILVPN